MLVKIGDVIYDSANIPILLIFNAKEIKYIQNMSDMVGDNYKYCSFPDDTKEEDIEEFMRTDDVDRIGFVQY